MNSKLKLKPPSRLEWIILAIIGGILFALGSWWAISSIIDAQKTFPLGDGVEYIGKTSSTCPIGPTPVGFDFGFCKKRSVYYYATDLNEDDLKHYFKEADVQENGFNLPESPVDGFTLSDVDGTPIDLVIHNSNYVFTVFYMRSASAVARYISLKSTPKKHIVRVFDSDYRSAFLAHFNKLPDGQPTL